MLEVAIELTKELAGKELAEALKTEGGNELAEALKSESGSGNELADAQKDTELEKDESKEKKSELGDLVIDESKSWNPELVKDLTTNFEKLSNLTGENFISDGIEILKDISDLLKELKDLNLNPEIGEYLESIEDFIDSIKEIAEKIENGEEITFKDIMSVVGPLLKVLEPLLKQAMA